MSTTFYKAWCDESKREMAMRGVPQSDIDALDFASMDGYWTHMFCEGHTPEKSVDNYMKRLRLIKETQS